jgi:hypothetical protein
MRTLVYASANRSDGDIDVFSNLGGRLATLQLPAETATYAGFEQIAARPGTDAYVGATYLSSDNFTVKIFAFAPGAAQSTQTLDDGMGIIQAMVVAKNGELAVCRTADGDSVIDFFEPGATSVSRSISNSPLEDVFGAAYAPDGTLWLAGLLRGGTLTFAYVSPGGTTVVPAIPAPTIRGFSDVLTLAIDGQGRLVSKRAERSRSIRPPACSSERSCSPGARRTLSRSRSREISGNYTSPIRIRISKPSPIPTAVLRCTRSMWPRVRWRSGPADESAAKPRIDDVLAERAIGRDSPHERPQIPRTEQHVDVEVEIAVRTDLVTFACAFEHAAQDASPRLFDVGERTREHLVAVFGDERLQSGAECGAFERADDAADDRDQIAS